VPDLSCLIAASAPSAGLWAYFGLPGQEFIPYTLSLLAFFGAMFFAVIQWPFFALLRFIRRSKRGAKDASPVEEGLPATEEQNEPSRAIGGRERPF
jgi:hypothetical protein